MVTTTSVHPPRKRNTVVKAPGTLTRGQLESGKSGTLSQHHTPVYGYFPGTSYAGSACQDPLQDARQDIELGPRVSSPFHQPRNKLKSSIADKLFRKDKNNREDRGVQVSRLFF